MRRLGFVIDIPETTVMRHCFVAVVLIDDGEKEISLYKKTLAQLYNVKEDDVLTEREYFGTDRRIM